MEKPIAQNARVGSDRATSTLVSSLAAHSGVQQLLKFCVVGLSSTVIDFGLFNLLCYKFHVPPVVALSVSFLVAVCNGFYWNRRWTFEAQTGQATRQYPKFLATNTVGWLLNLSITAAVLIFAEGVGLLHTKRTAGEVISLLATGQGRAAFHPLVLNGAKAVATVFVTAWNFTASRFWTFKS
jgi:putative flippase GtrA